jgi:ribonuclease P protein component
MLTRVPPAGDLAAPPSVAFAIGRKLGPAVARNQLRRRLRAIFSAAAAEGRVPPGAYLAVVRPEAMDASFSQLKTDVTTSLDRIVAMDEVAS